MLYHDKFIPELLFPICQSHQPNAISDVPEFLPRAVSDLRLPSHSRGYLALILPQREPPPNDIPADATSIEAPQFQRGASFPCHQPNRSRRSAASAHRENSRPNHRTELRAPRPSSGEQPNTTPPLHDMSPSPAPHPTCARLRSDSGSQRIRLTSHMASR